MLNNFPAFRKLPDIIYGGGVPDLYNDESMEFRELKSYCMNKGYKMRMLLKPDGTTVKQDYGNTIVYNYDCGIQIDTKTDSFNFEAKNSQEMIKKAYDWIKEDMKSNVPF